MELLAPAGNLEKLKIALIYGADAVYFGLPGFSLRARASQFNKKEIKEGADLCRKKGKKFFVALNIYAHNNHINNLDQQLVFVKEIQPDGIILSDPGILRVVKKELPEIDIHISTQANVTNKEAARFWFEQGVKRVILAREVSIKEIKEIKKEVPELELEYFVHGAMCMAYSGRCILSKWMLNRSANLGDCAQPCRWQYKGTVSKLQFSSKFLNFGYNLFHKVRKYTIFNHFSQLRFARNLEIWFEKRARGQSLKNKKERQLKMMGIVDDQDRFEIDLEEDDQGTYLFNSNDICLIEHLKELQEAGIDSFKIEGRTKSVYYVAMVVRAYRKVIKAILENNQEAIESEVNIQKKELEELSNRGYWTGFAFQDEPPHLFDKASEEAGLMFIGIGLFDAGNKKSNIKKVFVHNHFQKGDLIEVVTPDNAFKTNVIEIKDQDGNILESAHGGQNKIFQIEFDVEFEDFFMMRKLMDSN